MSCGDPQRYVMQEGWEISQTKLGNPAVVGLGGFGMTTLILQCHNLGWCGIGPVLWIGLVFGGTAQLIAGILEFKTGNIFGFCAFSGYGAFWIALCFYIIFGKNTELVKMYPFLKVTAKDLGFFLLMWTFFYRHLVCGIPEASYRSYYDFPDIIPRIFGPDY